MESVFPQVPTPVPTATPSTVPTTAPTTAPTIDPTIVKAGSAAPRGLSYVTNLLLNASVDDAYYSIPLPFSFTVWQQSFNEVFISTNG